MASAARRLLPTTLRLVVCAVALWWVLRSLSWEGLRTLLRQADGRSLAAALAVLAPVPFLLAVRLAWLLRANGVAIGLWRAVAVTFAGLFANFVLPGQTGGDVVKAVYLARDTHRRHEAATVVFFDRVLGLMCVVLLSGVMLLANWRDPAVRGWGRTIGLAFVVILVPCVLYFSATVRRLLGRTGLLERLPLREHLRRVDQAVLAYRNHRGVVVRAMLLTWVLQAVSIVSTYFAGRALGVVGDSDARSIQVYFVYVPLCWMAGALPISPQGLGVLEAAYTQFLWKTAGFGSAEGAAMLSMLTRVLNLAWALPGVAVYLRSGRAGA